jgi:hypothetical protein
MRASEAATVRVKHLQREANELGERAHLRCVAGETQSRRT